MDSSRTRGQPYRVGILLIDGFPLMSYASAAEPLRAANLFAGRALYDVQNLAASGTRAVSSGGAFIEATATLEDAQDLDHVFVVAGGDPAAFREQKIFRWLQRTARRGVPLGGISGGPVILALAGLMEARRMTVHWEHAPALCEISPTLMVERSLYVMDRDRMTCAGGVAPLDMMHALLTQHHGPSFARQVSDWFLHTDIRPSGGPQRAGLSERYGITNLPLIAAIEAMENHVANPLNLKQVAALAGLGARQMTRLFAEKLGQSAMAFYRDLRLTKARNLLTQSPLAITEIALATGFYSSAHFSKCFRARYGEAPSTVRNRVFA